MTDSPPNSSDADHSPQWKPLSSIDRRVLGVLVEKAKTTPDNYPLSLNAICSGCNQKSNRDPLMNLEPDDVEESLDRLRELGAVGLVQGIGRVTKYRHYAYQWLGVDKVELAVMAELLLRGAQTEGELRGRAARMEPIAGLPELRPVLTSLKSKGLVVPITPEGRGHVVTHALYQPAELEKLRSRHYGSAGITLASTIPQASTFSPPESPREATPNAMPTQPREEILAELPQLLDLVRRTRQEVQSLGPTLTQPIKDELIQLKLTLDEVRQELRDLRKTFEE